MQLFFKYSASVVIDNAAYMFANKDIKLLLANTIRVIYSIKKIILQDKTDERRVQQKHLLIGKP